MDMSTINSDQWPHHFVLIPVSSNGKRGVNTAAAWGKSPHQQGYKTQDALVQSVTPKNPYFCTKMALVKLCKYKVPIWKMLIVQYQSGNWRFTLATSCFSLFSLDFSPVLLLLVLICPLWQVSQSIPVTSNEQISDQCVFSARALLRNITDILSQVGLQRWPVIPAVIVNLW